MSSHFLKLPKYLSKKPFLRYFWRRLSFSFSQHPYHGKSSDSQKKFFKNKCHVSFFKTNKIPKSSDSGKKKFFKNCNYPLFQNYQNAILKKLNFYSTLQVHLLLVFLTSIEKTNKWFYNKKRKNLKIAIMAFFQNY